MTESTGQLAGTSSALPVASESLSAPTGAGRGRPRDALLLAPLAMLAVVAALPLSPGFTEYPNRDSGVYLYVAGEILDGRIPYRDAWDHKPPGIYYLDAAALALSGRSLWGIWALELLAWLVAVAAGFSLMRRAFGAGPAVLASVGWIGGLVAVLQGGVLDGTGFRTGAYTGANLTEEYALPFQFLALLLYYDAERSTRFGWRGILVGTAGTACFLLRPNQVAIPIAILAVVVATRWRAGRPGAMAGDVARLAAGALAPLGLVAAYFAGHGALDDLIDGVFGYNAAYVANRPFSILDGAQLEYRILSQSGLAVLALLGWGLALATPRSLASPGQRLVAVSLIATPLEVALSVMSGRLFPHYFIAWLPVSAVLVAHLAAQVQRSLTRPEGQARAGLSAYVAYAVAVVAIGLAPAWTLIHQQFGSDQTTNEVKAAAAAYIAANTDEDDAVLIWGSEASLNYMADRRSPTRYVYQLPLYTLDYQEPEQVDRLLRDLRSDPPVLIVDVSTTDARIPPIDPAAREAWQPQYQAGRAGSAAYGPLPEMEAVYVFLGINYRQITTVDAPGGRKWPVYRRIDPPAA